MIQNHVHCIDFNRFFLYIDFIKIALLIVLALKFKCVKKFQNVAEFGTRIC